jgi:hypothetical protein
MPTTVKKKINNQQEEKQRIKMTEEITKNARKNFEKI